MFWLQWNSSRTWSSKLKSKTSPVSSNSPAPSLTTVLLGRPVPCSALRETCRTALWQGFWVGTVIFLVLFVLSIDISKSPLASVSKDAFPSASFLQSTHFCPQTSLQVLFILGVHQSYSTMQWLLLSNVLLSLLVCPVYSLCGVSQLGCRPSDKRDCPFIMYLETPTVLLQPEYFFFLFVFVIGPPAVRWAFCFFYECCCTVKLPSQVTGPHRLWFVCSFIALTWWLCVQNTYGFLQLLSIYKPTQLHCPRRPADWGVHGPYQSSQAQLCCLQGVSLP